MSSWKDSSPFYLLGFKKSCNLAHEYNDFFRDYMIQEINLLSWILLITITALLSKKLALLLQLWAKGRKIPGPPCSSFYGHSKLISGAGTKDNLNNFLSESHEKYGSIIKLWLGPTQLLVSVKDPALIKEVLEKAEDKLPLTGRAFLLAFGQSSLFVSSFEKVQHGRESLAKQLNQKLLERASAVSLKVVDSVMERLHTTIAKGLLDCRSFSQHMAFSILGATVFGDAFLAWSGAAVYRELLTKVAKDGCFWASYNIPPIWKIGFWRYRCLCTSLKCFTQDLIQECRRGNTPSMGQMDQIFQGDTTNVVTGTVSSGSIMADNLFLEDLSANLNLKEESCGNIIGVMFHGSLATAELITSILTRLVMQPEIQAEIYLEITRVCKPSSKPEAHEVQNMSFLLATVYESARLLPAGPLLQRCSLKYDLNLKTGIVVPAGAIVVVPVQLVQMDGSNWGDDANQFNPHRFLSKTFHQGLNTDEAESISESSFTDSRKPFVLVEPKESSTFLPFGSGTRACVGQKFAILGIATMFASLLQEYEIGLCQDPESGTKPVMNNCCLGLLPSPTIIFIRRD